MLVVADNRRVTLLQHGRDRLSRLCANLGFDVRDEQRMVEILARMGTTWGGATAARTPRWPSDICDDGSPFELSVAIDGGVPELRILAEVQAPSPNVFSNWRAAVAFTEELESTAGISLARFRAVEELFAPTLATRRFSLWHAVCFRPGEPPDFKLYLNPAASGPGLARGIVEQALSRLGFPEAAAQLPKSTTSDRIIYFSLDLAARGGVSGHSAPGKARVKVYTAHHDTTPAHVEAALRVAAGAVPGQVSAFCEAMGGSPGPFHRRPVQTCLSFTTGSAAPTSGTVYFPVRAYADTDLEVRNRVLAYLPPEPAAIYRRALEAHAERRLDEGVGMQTYLSLRQGPGPQRITVYLSPELYSIDRSCAAHVSGVVTRHRR